MTAAAKKARLQDKQLHYRVADHPIHYLAAIQRQYQLNVTRALRPFGATAQMWRVLAILVDYGGCTISHLADMAVLDRTALGRLLETMERDGLVTRASGTGDDRRATLVELSAKGAELYELALPKILRLVETLLEGVGAAEFQTLMRTLRRMKANVRSSSEVML